MQLTEFLKIPLDIMKSTVSQLTDYFFLQPKEKAWFKGPIWRCSWHYLHIILVQLKCQMLVSMAVKGWVHPVMQADQPLHSECWSPWLSWAWSQPHTCCPGPISTMEDGWGWQGLQPLPLMHLKDVSSRASLVLLSHKPRKTLPCQWTCT